MLKDIFELAKNAISKSLIIFKVFLEKLLEIFLCHRIVGFDATFLLMPLLNHCLVEKQDGKKNSIWLIGLGSFEMILILLAKTIAIKM